MWPFKKKRNYQIMQLGNVRVWVFAEPFEALEPMWEMASVIAPKTLIQEADDVLEFKGQLIRIMPETYPIDKMPRMTDSERRSLLDKLSNEWMRYSGKTELITYNVVVML